MDERKDASHFGAGRRVDVNYSRHTCIQVVVFVAGCNERVN